MDSDTHCSSCHFIHCFQEILAWSLYAIHSFFERRLQLAAQRVFPRQRPDIEASIEQDGYSFPSAHSMGSFIFYGAMAFALFRLYDHTWSRIIGATTLLVLVFLIGLSRVYLGVHYPSDILGGFSAGGVWLAFSILVYTFIKGARPWRKLSSDT